jgi:DNA mismatch endonuclease (patch repair protein)
MADVFTKAKRSEVMSKIRSRGNRDTELALARLMRANRISGWRRHLPITGRPDFAFRRQRVAVFVDGCFWHRCPKCRLRPATNRVFWESKLGRNQQRDSVVNRTLRRGGWRVVRIWEHEFRKPEMVARKVLKALA